MSTRDEYVESLKSAYVSIATRLALAAIVSLVPETWNPVVIKIVTKLFEPLLNYVNQKVAQNSEMLVFFKFIDTRSVTESKDFNDAAFSNWKIQQSGTAEEKTLAEEKLWTAFKAFAVLTS